MADAAGLEVRLAQDAPIPLAAEFACAPGEVLAIVGPSGAGKSTMLRAVAGLVRPRDGFVRCAGETWFDAGARIHVPVRRRRIGYVFQSYALFPHMTALDNVACAAPGSSRDVARDWLARVHLAGLEDRRPAELSGGQQQRVAVARALARRPAALLLDEPFAAVDKVTRRKLYRELAELRRSLDMPTLLVTHDLDEAAMLADRIVVVAHGRTLQTGTPAEVTSRPVSVAVARLVDLRNVFEGSVVGHDAAAATTRLAWAGLTLECRHQPWAAPGARIAWCVPAAEIVLHRRDRPSRGEVENPVRGTVAELVALGEVAHLTLAVPGSPEPIALAVPLHVARRNGLAPGVDAAVSLRRDGLHLMPPEGVDSVAADPLD